MDELLTRHRKEKRDLQSKITQKKKSATKKTRKGVNDECDALERDLATKQAAEIAAANGTVEEGLDAESTISDADDAAEPVNHDTSAVDQTSQDSIHEVEQATSKLNIENSENGASAQRKPNRNKARLARRAAERDALAAEAADEAQHMPDLKAREMEVMTGEFRKRGLQEKEISADGHCLYSAIADGLKQQDIGLKPRIPVSRLTGSDASQQIDDYRLIRYVAAEYIAGHPDDFAPFLEEPLDQYVKKISDTGEWGGQLELLALAKAYGVDISVIQGDGRVEEIHGEGEDRKRLWLAYYKHNFGLGEHYNSLRQ